MLVDHPHSGAESSGRGIAREVELAPGDLEAARVGPHEPKEHVHERRLAGAVFAEEREDLARADVE